MCIWLLSLISFWIFAKFIKKSFQVSLKFSIQRNVNMLFKHFILFSLKVKYLYFLIQFLQSITFCGSKVPAFCLFAFVRFCLKFLLIFKSLIELSFLWKYLMRWEKNKFGLYLLFFRRKSKCAMALLRNIFLTFS